MATESSLIAEKKQPKPRWYQYSLRSLLLVVGAGAVLCSLLKWFGLFFFLRVFEHAVVDYGLVIPAAFMLACGMAGWAVARRFQFSRHMSVASFVVIAFLILTATACIYVAWARHRVLHARTDVNPSAVWCHPDRALVALYAYHEAHHPTPPGFISLHGKWPEVRLTLDAVLFVLAGMTGGCLGPLILWLPPIRRKRQTPEAPRDRRWFVSRRYARLMLGLASAAVIGWLLMEMEQLRKEWEDQAKWAAAGASASYEDGKLIGLHFNALTLSMHYYDTKHFSDADVRQLAELTDLESLALADTRITDAGLEHLVVLTKLKRLDLDGTQITDAGLKHVAGFTNLECLSLNRTQVTDAGMPILAGLPDLRILSLDGTRISDAGLVHLSQLRHLQYLDISNTQVSGRGVEELREALPDCDIWR